MQWHDVTRCRRWHRQYEHTARSTSNMHRAIQVYSTSNTHMDIQVVARALGGLRPWQIVKCVAFTSTYSGRQTKHIRQITASFFHHLFLLGTDHMTSSKARTLGGPRFPDYVNFNFNSSSLRYRYTMYVQLILWGTYNVTIAPML